MKRDMTRRQMLGVAANLAGIAALPFVVEGKMLQAILYQDGGCDYTIGCGVKVIELKAETVQEAREELDEWFGGDEGPDRIEIFRVEKIGEFDMEGV